MRRAANWLIAIQNPDGGWGEDGTSYKLDYRGYERAPSTASQTAWALLGLMAAGEVDAPAVARGIELPDSAHRTRKAFGTSSSSRRRAFRAYSICAITDIRSSSRSGRWRGTAISRRPTAGRSGSGCEFGGGRRVRWSLTGGPY